MVLSFVAEMLQGSVKHGNATGKRRRGHVVVSLQTGGLVEVDGRKMSLGKTLRHHEGNESGAGADVEHAPPAVGPCAEQGAIGAYFHGAKLLPDGELLEFEETICHRVSGFALNDK